MSAIKLIQVAKRDLGLEEDDYRAVLLRVTGKVSLKAMDDGEKQRVIGEMKRLGFAVKGKGGALDGPYAAKLTALWLSAWNLGITRSAHENALIAFVERQTGIAHVRWVREPRDAAKAIEGLKSWIAREAGVEWPTSADATVRDSKVAVIAAQHVLLGITGTYRDNPANKAADLDGIIAALGARIRKGKA